jgi:peptidyl-prolyl cis-trans isomerase B (cyclophilin B)
MNFVSTSVLRRGLLILGAAFALHVSAQASTPAASPRVKLSTNMGDIVLELNAAQAPKTVANFLSYVKSGHYNGTVFHRVIPGFMVQGGGMDSGLREKATQAPIENEATNGLKNNKYTVAMARTSSPHSASAQFFINIANNDFLNHSAPTLQGWGYAVFGKVVEGTDVVDKISAVRTGNAGRYQDVPQSPIIINAATVLP